MVMKGSTLQPSADRSGYCRSDCQKPNGVDLKKTVRALEQLSHMNSYFTAATGGIKLTGWMPGRTIFWSNPFPSRSVAGSRRSTAFAGSESTSAEAGDITLESGSANTVAGEWVELTAYEYKMLEYLMLHAGQVI